MKKITLPFLTAGVLAGLLMFATPATATHDAIYSPCSTEYGFIHMTYDEWAAHITTMEADGTIPPGIVFRYYEELHGGKGTNVQEDGTIPAWDNWAGGLTDGQILSIDDWANGNYPEIEALMFSSGLIPEWILDANMVIRRFNDPYWAAANPMTPTFTVWQSLCMGDYGYSIPVMEINEDGVWVSNLPATTTTVAPATTTTTVAPATTTTAAPATTTTTQAPLPDPEPGPAPEQSTPAPPPSSSGLPDGYDLFDAEWDGYPFEYTVLLLEERYPPGTPGKFHFRLSYAVEFLRNGGMVRGLDNLWESTS
jgi:hypothetical protein